MSKRIGLLGCLLAAALFTPWAAAQVNYKSTMPDGKVIYGDKPVPGAAKVDQLKAPPTQGITPPSSKEKAVLKDLEKSRSQRDVRADRVRSAQEALRKAEAALAAGKEPREGERVANANGTSRLDEAYFQRQRELEADVARARAEFAAAQASAQTAQRSGQKDSSPPHSARDKAWLNDK